MCRSIIHAIIHASYIRYVATCTTSVTVSQLHCSADVSTEVTIQLVQLVECYGQTILHVWQHSWTFLGPYNDIM